MQRLLVPLHRHQVVTALLADLLDDHLLAEGRVERHQRAPEVQNLQQRGHGHDLVGPVGHRHLAQEQVVLGGPSVDQVQAPAERVAGGRPARLAVNRDGPQPRVLAQVGHPPGEARRELVPVQRREHPVERVVAGDAVGQRQERLEPVHAGVAEPLDLLEAVGPADDRAQGDDKDVVESVPLGPIHTRVGQIGKVPGETYLRLRHGGASWATAGVCLSRYIVSSSRCVDPASFPVIAGQYRL